MRAFAFRQQTLPYAGFLHAYRECTDKTVLRVKLFLASAVCFMSLSAFSDGLAEILILILI